MIERTNKFEFWVQRVLPQVYDESLSYYELLNKVVSFLNDVIDQTNGVTDFTEKELKEMRQDIATFLSEYEDNLADTVADTLGEWQSSGKLEVVIADGLQWELDDYKATNEADKLSINQHLAQTIHKTDTVTTMKNLTLFEGLTVQTNGYYQPLDGGAMLYEVALKTNTEQKSYHIEKDDFVFLPKISGVINPKQFGTFNDNVRLDNFPLQACYDYAFDYDISVIDGLNMNYLIGTENPYDEVVRGWAHTGALMQSGRTLQNFRFKTASGSTNGTVPLSIQMRNVGTPTHLINIEIDGNRANVSEFEGASGREDGGSHCIHLYHPDENNNQLAEFFKCDDIYMQNVTLKDHYSYGIRIEHLDCLVRLTDCRLETTGIGLQVNATKVEVLGGEIYTKQPRTGMVPNPLQSEIEFSQNYEGVKQVSLLVEGVKIGGSYPTATYKISYLPSMGLKWEKIKIINNDFSNQMGVLEIYNGGTETLSVRDLIIKDNKNVRDSVTYMNTLDNQKIIYINNLTVDNTNGSVFIYNVELLNAHFSNLVFKKDKAFERSRFTATNVTMTNCYAPNMGLAGIWRSADIIITNFNLKNNTFVGTGQAVLFEHTVRHLNIDNLSILVETTNRKHNRIFFMRNQANGYTRVIFRNSILQGAGPINDDSALLLFDANTTDGYCYFDNVHYENTAQPNAVGLYDPTKVVLANSEPIFNS